MTATETPDSLSQQQPIIVDLSKKLANGHVNGSQTTKDSKSSDTEEQKTDGAAQNKSFVLSGIQKVTFEDRPVPTLEDPHDVLLQVNFTGTCGSDVHYWAHGKIGKFILEKPMVLGHESSGTVVKVGSAVRSLKVGDRVAMEPGVPCRRCTPCMAGKYNLCADMAFAATPPYDGTLAKYYRLPEDFCYKLPEHVSLQEGALLEPLAVGVHIMNQAHVKYGDSVVVFGAGPVGLLCCAVARAYGAKKVIAVDVQQQRLDFAKTFAATSIFTSERVSAIENATRLKVENDLGLGVDVAIDASGAEPCVQTAIHALRPGGSYIQGGMGKDEFVFPLMAVCSGEITVHGSFRYGSGDYQTALNMVADGRIDVKQLISRVVAFEDAEQAYVDTKAGKGIKVLIAGPE